MTSAFAYQINFDDHPDKTVLDERIEKLKGIFDNKNIFDTKGFVKDCLGVGDTIAAVKDLVLMLSLIIIILLAVLMERSFISKERAETALMKAVGCNDINEVSGGQLQRACICRSMINSPKMIFADEPTGALNRSGSDEVRNELISLNRDDTTIMCVTHDPKVAADVLDEK